VQNLDLVILVICIGLAWPNPALGEPLLERLEKQFALVAAKKWISLITIGASAIVVRLALLRWMPVPQPKVHDEFSYLLAADTFAHGRLTNPPHPLWIFFDTFHVLHHPTYASIYPPAQGGVLAIGQWLSHPWIGVLLSAAAMCMAMTWMLQGWMPPEWALLGGMLVLSRFGVFSYGVNSYWGGCVAATGAALALGALPRIFERQRPRDAVVFGLGAGILATSRPLEGFIFCLPLGVALVWWTLRQKPPARQSYSKRILLPLAAILVCIAGFVGYYNWRVTGSPVVFPHFVELRMYITTPAFLWQKARTPLTYANPQFEVFYNTWMPSTYQRSWSVAMYVSHKKLVAFWNFFLGPALSIPFLALPWMFSDRKMRLLLAQFAFSAAGLLGVVWFLPHYAAPLLATVVLLAMQGLRILRAWSWRGRPIGIALVRMIVLFSVLIGPVYFAIYRWPAFSDYWISDGGALPLRYTLGLIGTAIVLMFLRLRAKGALQSPAERTAGWSALEFVFLVLMMAQICFAQRMLHSENYPFENDSLATPRTAVERRLLALPGEHLVLVRYPNDHISGEDSVYNEADIDHAKIVWARMIPGRDLSPLLTYFQSRDVWVVEPDENPLRVYPYAPQRSVP
jgi:hypothetical protein